MRKSEKNSVAIFLAAALLTGIFAVSTPTIIDTEATEDKGKYYKQKDRDGDRNGHGDYSRDGDGKDRHSDYSSYYSKDGDGKDRHSDYSRDGDRKDRDGDRKDRDGDRDHDGKGDVKYISCKNININGKSFQTGGGDGPRNFDGFDGMRGEADGYGKMSNSYTNHPDKFPGQFIKETDKDVTVICIQNNDGNVTKDPKTCPECIEKFLSDDQLTALEQRLNLPQFELTLEEYCQLFVGDNVATIIAGLVGDFTATTPPIVLSPEKLQELAECIFKALNESNGGSNSLP